MATAIHLTDSLYKQLGEVARNAGVNREELAVQILQEGLALRSAQVGDLPPRSARTPFPVSWDSGEMLVAPTNAAINKLLEEEDLGSYLSISDHDADRSTGR